MRPPMNQTAYKITRTRDEFGSYTATAETALPCHWRDITILALNQPNEQADADAMAWFYPEAVIKGDIVKYNDEYYQVERMVPAKRLHHPETLFLKCWLRKYGNIS